MYSSVMVRALGCRLLTVTLIVINTQVHLTQGEPAMPNLVHPVGHGLDSVFFARPSHPPALVRCDKLADAWIPPYPRARKSNSHIHQKACFKQAIHSSFPFAGILRAPVA